MDLLEFGVRAALMLFFLAVGALTLFGNNALAVANRQATLQRRHDQGLPDPDEPPSLFRMRVVFVGVGIAALTVGLLFGLSFFTRWPSTTPGLIGS
ncbi:MAG: hypothetical protein FJ318_09910 [SAR202 cluster bacterium]|nr:hypothetical protein [SAR202 cluster bacterium]